MDGCTIPADHVACRAVAEKRRVVLGRELEAEARPAQISEMRVHNIARDNSGIREVAVSGEEGGGKETAKTMADVDDFIKGNDRMV